MMANTTQNNSVIELHANNDTSMEGWDAGQYDIASNDPYELLLAEEAMFLMEAETTLALTTFNISHSGEVDWGDGIFVPFVAGDVTNTPTGNITVRSTGATKIKMITDTFVHVDIKNALPLTDAGYILEYKNALLTVKIKGAKNIDSFSGAFSFCSNVTSIEIDDTSSNRSMGGMFYKCFKLLKVPYTDTSSCYIFTSAFWECSLITTIPYLDTSLSRPFFNGVFGRCYALTHFQQDEFLGEFTDISQLFQESNSIIKIPTIKSKSLTNLNWAFYDCTSLTEFPIEYTKNILNWGESFAKCSSLISVPIIQLADNKTVNLENIFWGCASLVKAGGFIGNANVINWEFTFQDCGSLVCVGRMDTTGDAPKSLMFDNNVLLQHPTPEEVVLLMSAEGYKYRYDDCSEL